MEFKKKDLSLQTVSDVVERNVGIPIEEFLHPNTNPEIAGLKKAAGFIKDYLAEHPDKQITVVGDYDCDGICATAILAIAFAMLRRPAKLRLPKRFSEGYGLSEKIIDEIPDGLVVTVDNGIAAYPAIKKAKDKELAVVVTDHHLAPVDDKGNLVLPPADLVMDPAAEDISEFHNYCGAALAYRLACELLPEKNLINLKILASIATVADVMPLIGANRTLVIDGLAALNKGYGVPAIREILKGMSVSHVQEGDYGFKIGPVFNASGRLYDAGASRVLDALITKRSDPMMEFKIRRLLHTNEKRKDLVKEQMETANTLDLTRPIVVYDPSFHEGIIGIIAGRLCEDHECPCIVFTDADKEGFLKGSGRSIPEIHLKNVLDSISDDIVGYGGHAGAAGLTIRKENLKKFADDFRKACGHLPEKTDTVEFDLAITQDQIPEAVEELEKFSPFGEGNPKIRFRIQIDATPFKYSQMGDGSHFALRGEASDGKELSVVGFGMTEKYEEAGKPRLMTCVGYLEPSWFQEKKSYKFELIEFMAD